LQTNVHPGAGGPVDRQQGGHQAVAVCRCSCPSACVCTTNKLESATVQNGA
jgi:hypothetical protein